MHRKEYSYLDDNFINKLFCLKLIPRMWRSASIITILRPGKDPKLEANDPFHCSVPCTSSCSVWF